MDCSCKSIYSCAFILLLASKKNNVSNTLIAANLEKTKLNSGKNKRSLEIVWIWYLAFNAKVDLAEFVIEITVAFFYKAASITFNRFFDSPEADMAMTTSFLVSL